MRTILVTGLAGFIGFHLAKLLKGKVNIVGIDNLNDYYTPELKKNRLRALGLEINDTIGPGAVVENNGIIFHHLDLCNQAGMEELFNNYKFDVVVNLAAQAGVRYSLVNPRAYINTNIVGFFNILELSKHYKIKHFLYASSSSVYGGNKTVPFSTDDRTDFPVSLYAATKKSNELIAHTYSHLYNLKTTGLRFFTVYGPWGRPDMAPMLFTKAIMNDKPITVYNEGEMYRDFTYVGDIVSGIAAIIFSENKSSNANRKDQVFNIGLGEPMLLNDFITTLEDALGKVAEKRYAPMQPGDVYQTYADTTKLVEAFDFQPKTSLKEGIVHFANWYKKYYETVCAE